MPDQELVKYLRKNLGKFSAAALKEAALKGEVEEAVFKEALAVVEKERLAKKRLRSFLLSLVGLGIVGYLATFVAEFKPGRTLPGSKAMSSFVSSMDYVVSLPPGYTAIRQTAPGQPGETIFFCEVDTDPGALIDQGLYGGLGIVRLEALPLASSGFSKDPDVLSKELARAAKRRGEKFDQTLVNLASMRGVQMSYPPPFARIEAYVPGRSTIYFFLAGKDDDTYHFILHGLRDLSLEN